MERHDVVVVERDTPRAELGEAVHGRTGSSGGLVGVAEGVACCQPTVHKPNVNRSSLVSP